MINLKNYIADVPNFPKEGILFRDITPLLQDGQAFHEAINQLLEFANEIKPDLIVGPESRGFIFGCPLSDRLGIGFVPVRKPGKLPRKVDTIEYNLEYGTNSLSVHVDAIKPGQRVLIIDDLLATGGTIKATIELIEKMGGIVVGCGFLIKLINLEGDKTLAGYPLKYLMEY